MARYFQVGVLLMLSLDSAKCPLPVPQARRSDRLREVISGLLLGSGALYLGAVQAAEVEEVLVVDRQSAVYRLKDSALGKLTEALRDTPQSVTTLTRELLEDRGALSLTDALRNVPGITLGAGEFSWQGNNPNIRGFSSRNDMFLDGMRDFGNYDRDPFNLDSIEVLLGPSSLVFGRGSTGGVINQTSKRPVADPVRALHINVGNADTRRAEIDVNQPLSDSAALRVNLLKHEAGMPGRDTAFVKRDGFASSLALELGSATELSVDLLHQSSASVPDYGLPWLAGRPAAVERDSFYGFGTDFVDTTANIASIKLDHEFTPDLQLQAQLRRADYQRSTRITEPLLVGNPTTSTPLATVQVRRNVFHGESTERMLQGQVNLIATLQTGSIEHALVAGIELGEESSAPGFGFGLGVPNTPLLAPRDDAYSSTGIAWRLLSDAQADSVGGFVLDTLKFNEHWQLMAGLRWDSFDIDYAATRFNDAGIQTGTERILRKDIETSWRSALVYKPVQAGTIYAGIGTSFNPSAEGLSFINSGRNLTISDAYLDPEDNRAVELGTKWELFEAALYIDAALYRISKQNARVPDPATPGFNILGGQQTVDGFSLNLVGRLSPSFTVNAGYAYMHSEQGRTTQVTVLPGTSLANTPEHTANLWLSWTPALDWEVAGGARYVDERLATIAQPLKAVPHYHAFDLLLKYRYSDHLSFKLNVTNLTDEYYFEQLHPFHVVPGPGRSAVVAINLDY
jgi:catecholate siderophore receptor